MIKRSRIRATSWRGGFFILLLLIALVGCDKEPEIQIEPEVLTSEELIGTKSKEEISAFVQGSGLPFPSSQIKYDVDIYRITYFSGFDDREIEASGLVILPKTKDQLEMLSFQHGTIVAHTDAPSETTLNDDTMFFYAAMATPGFIGVVPDFFGFGSSKNLLHPYYVETATANAVIDNLKAARELALINGRKFGGHLFLAGYSQGGYATMAAHKAIEQSPIENFELVASFPASGGYDVKGVQEYFFAQTSYDQPFYLAYVAYAYKTYFEWSEPLSDFFQEPYASAIPGLFDGSKSGGTINAALTTSVPDLINPALLASIDSDPAYEYIVNAFEENSVDDFVPKIPVYMYHGDLDTTVPYQNSVEIHQRFIANGANPQVVTLKTLPFATHGSGVIPYLVDFIDKVLALK